MKSIIVGLWRAGFSPRWNRWKGLDILPHDGLRHKRNTAGASDFGMLPKSRSNSALIRLRRNSLMYSNEGVSLSL